MGALVEVSCHSKEKKWVAIDAASEAQVVCGLLLPLLMTKEEIQGEGNVADVVNGGEEKHLSLHIKRLAKRDK